MFEDIKRQLRWLKSALFCSAIMGLLIFGSVMCSPKSDSSRPNPNIRDSRDVMGR